MQRTNPPARSQPTTRRRSDQPRPALIQPLEGRRLMSAYLLADPVAGGGPPADLSPAPLFAMAGWGHAADDAPFAGDANHPFAVGLPGPAGGFGVAPAQAAVTAPAVPAITSAAVDPAASDGVRQLSGLVGANVPVAQALLADADPFTAARSASAIVRAAVASAPVPPTVFATAGAAVPPPASDGPGVVTAAHVAVAQAIAPMVTTDPAPLNAGAAPVAATVVPTTPAAAAAVLQPVSDPAFAGTVTASTTPPSFSTTVIESARASHPLAAGVAAGAAVALWVSTESARDRRREQLIQSVATAAADPFADGRLIAMGLFRG